MTKEVVRVSSNKWITFHCPGCKCSHGIPTQGKAGWQWNGDRVKPTVKPSLLLNKNLTNPGTPRCHNFIIDGKIQFLSDCTHELAGKTVDLTPKK